MTTTFNSAGDVQAVVGDHIGNSDWLEVSQERINTFAEATGDRQWIHVDTERAKHGPFGTTIAHGFLTLSLISLLGHQLAQFDFGTAKINYGLNKVRFITPVPAGGKVRASARLAGFNAQAKGAQVIIEYTIELEGSDRPACIAEQITLILP